MDNEIKKYNIGFLRTATFDNGHEVDVYTICESSTGKNVAYALSKEMALNIVNALNKEYQK